MSSKRAFLALRLVGPLQAWGFDSQYNRRNTSLMPTKSGIAGICAAALGYSRGGEKEQSFLELFRQLKLTSIAIPRVLKTKSLPVRRIQDFHTVLGTIKASGGTNNNAVITHRQYLTDASFGVLLEGSEDFLFLISEALQNPVWGIWLGRKACLPSEPVFVGIGTDREQILRLIIGDRQINEFTHQVDVENFADGKDSLPDNPVSFLSAKRYFSPRRIMTFEGKS